MFATNDAHLSSWFECIPSRELVHVADDQAGEKRAEVAAAARRVDREVARGITAMTATAGDSRQTPARRLETTSGERDAEDDSERRRDRRAP